MPYVSAQYAPPDLMLPIMPGSPKRITATDDNGIIWWLTEDSQVGDWLDYVAKGGTVDSYVEEPAAKPAGTGD